MLCSAKISKNIIYSSKQKFHLSKQKLNFKKAQFSFQQHFYNSISYHAVTNYNNSHKKEVKYTIKSTGAKK